MQTAWALLSGWIVAGLALWVLYFVGSIVGVIGRAYAYPGARPSGQSVFGARAVNDWPFPDSGLWTLLANVAVVALVLVLATVATAWSMRGACDHFSEGRLALVLLLTGWLPLYGGPIGGLLESLVAVWVVRVWVTRATDRLPVRTTIVTVAVLAAVAGTYGLLHPFLTTNVWIAPDRPHTATIVLHNAARVPVTVDRFTVTPIPSTPRQADAFTTMGFGAGHHTARFAPSSERFLDQPLPQGCGTIRLSVHVRYHMFGLPLTQTVPAFAKLGHPC